MAIVGASRTPEKVGAILLKNIQASGFRGQVYPVNPNVADINGLKCYPDIKSLPETPDLAVMAIPSDLVIDTLHQAGEKGIKNVVVLTAGFKEVGPEGEQLEKQLIEAAAKYDIALLGPNCLGFVNNSLPINATFGQQVKLTDNLRFVSQSGALATSLFDWFNATGLGFTEFVTLGNKAVLNENHVLRYFLDHPLTGPSPIGLYLESVSDGKEFVRLATQISRQNPIFILKPGKSLAAMRAMHSHTGAIAGEDAVLDAALAQAGITRCQESENFFDLARAFAWETAPAGPKVAVISNAGGPAVICADAVSEADLMLAEFAPTTKKELLTVLPRTASILDPVDVLGDALADRYGQAAEIILKTHEADALVVILTPQVMTQIEKTAQLIVDLSKKYPQPILCAFMGGSMVAEGEAILDRFKIPSFRYPERAIKSLSAMWRWKKWLNEQKEAAVTPMAPVQLDLDRPKEIVANALKEGRQYLDNLEANEILQTAGITTPATAEVKTLADATAFAQKVSYPVVLKLCSPGLLHKADVGGVVAQINNDKELETAWDKLEQKAKQLESDVQKGLRVQIQKEINYGVETIVGVRRDATFGEVMLFGTGGALVELLADHNLHLLPVDFRQAHRLVEGSKVFPLLNGYRGEPPYAVDKLCDLMVRLGKVAEGLPDISEVEINPTIVTLNDAWAVDCKVVLGQGVAKPTHAPRFKVATTVSHTVLAGNFHYFVFEPEVPLAYQPGQYLSVKVAEARVNSYSIAGRVDQNKFSLLIDVSPGGVGSKFFESLKVGEKISFLGPFGNFTLNLEDGSKQLLFLGTGSGLSPLKSMVEEALIEKNYQGPVSLYFGLRFPQDVFWKDYFEGLAARYKNFRFKLFLSKPDASWSGLIGHITEPLAADFADAAGVAVYSCGNKQMLDDAANILSQHGCPKERMYSEKFF